ncbi:polysaccharide deacetylase [Chitinimonas prasina]|uniref:Polysaccharide deacetylase n=1 Tax=Chitinimonas prasina TaxID=1434937 RepID=A0ABQ5YLA4_9NEIS|nr:polysaccharide deacetylase family protein [Chitinimonas prasina]GLR14502.1 polysaccharide deacetylase [Chitinimonas prasina]
MLLALKIEVDSLAAARDITPRLVTLLQSLDANASFFFNLGPDRSGQADGPLFQVGETRKQIRRNRALGGPRGASRLYGRWLPAPQLHKAVASAIQAIQQAGYETGLRGWDRVNWIKRIATADEAWVRNELTAALHAYEHLLGQPAQAIALPGWRTGRHALRLQQQLGLHYGSDCRGSSPFLPVVDGEPIRVPQLPTTLPTLAELTGANEMDDLATVDQLLALTASPTPAGHVFTLNADADGGKRLPLLQRLLAAWREQGQQFASLAQLHATLDINKLPWHSLEQRSWPGYSGMLAVQGPAFPRG